MVAIGLILLLQDKKCAVLFCRLMGGAMKRIVPLFLSFLLFGGVQASSDPISFVVARFVPLRAIRFLQTLQAYPVSDVVLRAKLLKKSIKRIDDMYGLVSSMQRQSQDRRFIEVLSRLHMVLRSTATVLTIEYGRSKHAIVTLPQKFCSGDVSRKAYKAAKKVFAQSRFDQVCLLLSGVVLNQNNQLKPMSIESFAAHSVLEPGQGDFFMALKKLIIEHSSLVRVLNEQFSVTSALDAFVKPVKKRYSLRAASRNFLPPFRY